MTQSNETATVTKSASVEAKKAAAATKDTGRVKVGGAQMRFTEDSGRVKVGGAQMRF